MSKGNVLSIDLAKNSFHIFLASADGRKLKSQKVSRGELATKVASLDADLIAMEACGSANFWARKFISMGREVKLIAPQFVKPFVKSQKNDCNDAEAIGEAAARQSMRFVPIKSIEQQKVAALHRIRQRLVGNQTALSNQLRGLLAEFGIIIPQGKSQLLKMLAKLIDENTIPEVSDFPIELIPEFSQLRDELSEVAARIAALDKKIEMICKNSERCQEILKIVGVGPLTASAVFAALGNGSQFKNGRQFSAFLGLVPRQNSTGGKTKLGGISKRGDTYLRTLLIHGARASMVSAHKRKDYRSRWVSDLKEKKGYNRAAVALANRNARVIFKLLTSNESFNEKAAEKQSMKCTKIAS